MGSNMVDAETGRKSNPTFDVVPFLQAPVASKSTGTIFDALCNFRQTHTRLDMGVAPFADLTVGLGTLTIFLEEVVVHAIEVSLLFIRRSIGIVILVFNLFTHRVDIIREEPADEDSWWVRLDLCAACTTACSLLLLGLPLLLLLCGSACCVPISTPGASGSRCIIIFVIVRVILI